MKQKPNKLVKEIEASMDGIFKGYQKYMVYRNGHTVNIDEAAAEVAEINTTMTQITGHMIQIYRAGHIVTGDAIVSVDGGTLIVESGVTTYSLQAGDVISWMAY